VQYTLYIYIKLLTSSLYWIVVRAVPGKKVLGVKWNLKMGVPPTQFYLFLWYSPYGYSRKHPHPPNFNWFQFHPQCPFFWNSPNGFLIDFDLNIKTSIRDLSFLKDPITFLHKYIWPLIYFDFNVKYSVTEISKTYSVYEINVIHFSDSL